MPKQKDNNGYKEYVILSHTGNKRGGWNVQWWLKGDPGSDKWFPYRKWAECLGLKIVCIPAASARYACLGPFRTKEEAITVAEKRGWSIITPQKMAIMVRKRR